LFSLYQLFKEAAASVPDLPLDHRFEQIGIDMCGLRKCYARVGGREMHTPIYLTRRVGNSYSYGLDGEPRQGAELYESVLARAFPRIRAATARRHEPGMGNFLAAHNQMQVFIAFYEYALTLAVHIQPIQCYNIVETFRCLLDNILETSR
jgi:hypothetical protein